LRGNVSGYRLGWGHWLSLFQLRTITLAARTVIARGTVVTFIALVDVSRNVVVPIVSRICDFLGGQCCDRFSRSHFLFGHVDAGADSRSGASYGAIFRWKRRWRSTRARRRHLVDFVESLVHVEVAADGFGLDDSIEIPTRQIKLWSR
jgi:hypothetical protein